MSKDSRYELTDWPLVDLFLLINFIWVFVGCSNEKVINKQVIIKNWRLLFISIVSFLVSLRKLKALPQWFSETKSSK